MTAIVPHGTGPEAPRGHRGWVQIAPTPPYDRAVSRVIQIRDVPDDVHEELRAAAEARGQSLTRYALAALEDAVRRQRSVAHNAEVIRRAKAEIGADVP